MPEQLEYPRVIFTERQRPRGAAAVLASVPIVALVLIFSIIALTAPRGPDLKMIFVFAAVTAFVGGIIALMRITTVVTSHEVIVRFPFWTRKIALHDIVEALEERYHPIREFGGWGIRWSFRDSTTCYTLYGNRGVRIRTSKNQKVLIGSQRATELAAAIEAARSRV